MKQCVTYPMLEIDENTIICDSHAIVAYLARANGREDLLGVDANH